MPFVDQRTRALIYAGLMKPVDLLFAGLIFLDATVTMFAGIFSPRFGMHWLGCALLVALTALGGWCVLLSYRIGVLVIEIRAEVNRMPEHAARLVRASYLGGPSGVREGASPQRPPGNETAPTPNRMT